MKNQNEAYLTAHDKKVI